MSKASKELFNLLNRPSLDRHEIIPHINRFLTVHPYAGIYEVDDREHVSSAKDRRHMKWHPSGDCLKCERLLYYERDVTAPPIVQYFEPRTQSIFKEGAAIHAMLQSWFKAMGELDGFPRFIGNEVRIDSDDFNISGYIDTVVSFGADRPADEATIIEIKGLALDTAIPTPNGFTTMGDIRVGDIVFDKDGAQCNVIAKSSVHNNPCYRVTFDDGTNVVCDENHRWYVKCLSYGSDFMVLTTKEILERGITFGRIRKQSKWGVPVSGALDCEHVELPVDPYILGLWLADGNKYNGSITEEIDSPIWAEIENRGFELGKAQHRDGSKAVTRTIKGIYGGLGSMHLLGNKHIPEIYMRASIEQRIQLVRGFFDGDGTYSSKRKQVLLSSTKKEYIDDVCALLSTLGVKTTICDYDSEGFGKPIHVWSVRLVPMWFNPFSARHQDMAINPKRRNKSKMRYIRTIEKIDDVPTQCIAVDSESHTYLYGVECAVTHNSINDYQFQQLRGPKPEHKMQVGAYMMATGILESIILYYNKNDSSMKEYLVEPIDMQNVLIRWQNVENALDAGSPESLARSCKQGSKQWERCPAKHICYRS